MNLLKYANKLSVSLDNVWRVSLKEKSVIVYSGVNTFRIPTSATLIEDFSVTDVRLGLWRPLLRKDLKDVVMGKPVFAVADKRFGTVVGYSPDENKQGARFPVMIRVPAETFMVDVFSYDFFELESVQVLSLSNGRVVTDVDVFGGSVVQQLVGHGFYGFRDFTAPKEATQGAY